MTSDTPGETAVRDVTASAIAGGAAGGAFVGGALVAFRFGSPF